MSSDLQSTMASSVLTPILLLVKNESKIQIHTWDDSKDKIAEVDSSSYGDALEICEVALWEKFAVGNSSMNPILISQPTQIVNVSKSISKWVLNHAAHPDENNAIIVSLTTESPAINPPK